MSAVDAEIDADAVAEHTHPSHHSIEPAAAVHHCPRAQRCVFGIRGRGKPYHAPLSPIGSSPGTSQCRQRGSRRAPHFNPRCPDPRRGPFFIPPVLPTVSPPTEGCAQHTTLIGGSASATPAVKGRAARRQAPPLKAGGAGATALGLSAGAGPRSSVCYSPTRFSEDPLGG